MNLILRTTFIINIFIGSLNGVDFTKMLKFACEMNKLKTDINIVLLDGTNYYLDSVPLYHLDFMDSMRIQYNIPFEIYYRLIYKESRFKHNIYSHAGAIGYAQVMPQTFEWVSQKHLTHIYDINNAYHNIECGAFLLKHLKDKIDQKYPKDNEHKKWKRVLASYNAGYSRHVKAMKSFPETKDYIAFIQKNHGRSLH